MAASSSRFDELDEIVEKFADEILGRGNERGVDGAQPAPADPVLIAANCTCVALLGGSFEERHLYKRKTSDPFVRDIIVHRGRETALWHPGPLTSIGPGCGDRRWAIAPVHAKVVSGRHGHASTQITLDRYSHVIESMQASAAEAIGPLPGRRGPALRGHARLRPGRP